jgi:putative inorganic carbon (HCO3(-)) transporter
MQLMIFSLFLGCVWARWRLPWLGLKEYKLPILIWLVYLFIIFLQTIPLPASLVGFLSPNALALQQLTHNSVFYLSTDYGQSQIALLKSVSYFCLFTATLMLVKDIKTLKTILVVILIAAAAQALYGTLEVLVGVKHSLVFGLPVKDEVTGSFVYKNHFANYIMLGLSAGIGIMVASLQETQTGNAKDFMRSIALTLLGNKALIRICLAIMVIALVMSKSRMGNVAFFASMTICGVIALALIRNRNRGLTILIVSMFIIDMFILSAWFGLDKVQERLAQTNLAQESRDEVVIDAMPIVLDFPLIGSGGGSFYSIFPQYKVAQVHSFYDHAHNDYLQMAIEYGVAATLLLALLVGLSLYKALHAMKHRKMSIMKGAAFASCMAIIGMLIHMTVDFPLQAPANAGYFVVFLALAWIVNTIKAQPRSRLSASSE